MALSVVRSELPPAELLARLQTGDSRPLDDLYRLHRPAFAQWAGSRYTHLTDDDFADAFQSAVIAFYENVRNGRLRELTAAPRTYLFTLGGRFCLKIEKKLALTIKVLPLAGIKEQDAPDDLSSFDLNDDLEPLADDPFNLADVDSATSDRADQVMRALQHLTPDCHRLLLALYYDNQSLTELSETLGHRDVNVTTVRKSQCLARLRALCGVPNR